MVSEFLHSLRRRVAALGRRIPPRPGPGEGRKIWRRWFPGKFFADHVVKRLPRLNRVTIFRFEPGSVIVAIGGVIVAIAGYFSINTYATSRIQSDLDRAADKVSAQLTEIIDRQISIAESAGTMFAGPNPDVNRWAFFGFARQLPAENPGFSAVEWIPRVSKRQRSRFERRAKADGLFDFQFVELGPDGRRKKAQIRSEYYPVYFVEPYPGNESELGLDLAAGRGVDGIFARVRDGGTTAAVPDHRLSGRNQSEDGISVIVPVYRSGVAPFSVAERRKLLSGFVRTIFRYDRVSKLLVAGIGGVTPLSVHIFDRSDEKDPKSLYVFSSQPNELQSVDRKTQAARSGIYSERTHESARWRWSLVVRPVGSPFTSVLALTAWGFVAFMLLLTALLVRHLTRMQIAREVAETANQAKSDFLAMMCHELRTPLNSVIGFSDMMTGELFGPLNDHYREYVSHINSSGTHLLGLINTILNFSKAEAGALQPERTKFALSALWESVHGDLESGIRGAEIDFEENLSGSPFLLDADSSAFHQILQNLVSNAIKFTPKGGRVTVTAEGGAKRGLVLRVADTGIGISEDDIEMVFKPFRQVDNSLSREYEGIGLGLPLTRMLVELHGGTLSIASRLKEGTEIRLNFPAEIIAGEDASPERIEEDEKPDMAEDAKVSTEMEKAS